MYPFIEKVMFNTRVTEALSIPMAIGIPNGVGWSIWVRDEDILSDGWGTCIKVGVGEGASFQRTNKPPSTKCIWKTLLVAATIRLRGRNLSSLLYPISAAWKGKKRNGDS